jgi:hypothetical protein
MPRQNRKKGRPRGVPIPAPFAAMVVVAAVAALVYIWLGCCEDALGREIKEREAMRDELARRIVNEESKWAEMKSPAGMERALTRWGLCMTWPRHAHIVYLEPHDVLPTPDADAHVAMGFASVHTEDGHKGVY